MTLRSLFAALLLLFAQGAALGADLVGRVVGIADGDTLTLLIEGNQQVRIRLAEIDAPERRQPYGDRSRQVLADLAFGRTVRVVEVDTDRYRRVVGRVYQDGVDVNAELVRRGTAWVFPRYSRDPSLVAIQAEAQRAQRGLWALPEAEAIGSSPGLSLRA